MSEPRKVQRDRSANYNSVFGTVFWNRDKIKNDIPMGQTVARLIKQVH